jgi:hypothetical protein
VSGTSAAFRSCRLDGQVVDLYLELVVYAVDRVLGGSRISAGTRSNQADLARR